MQNSPKKQRFFFKPFEHRVMSLCLTDNGKMPAIIFRQSFSICIALVCTEMRAIHFYRQILTVMFCAQINRYDIWCYGKTFFLKWQF